MLNRIPVLPIIGLIAVVGICVWIYVLGHEAGKDKVQAQWDAHKATYNKAIADAQTKLQSEQEAHARTSASIERDLLQLARDHDAELDALRRTFIDRLQHSEARADRYRIAADGTATERANLASYAAELDRALEEGIYLAGELEALIGQRDAQLKLLAKQIITDRELLDER